MQLTGDTMTVDLTGLMTEDSGLPESDNTDVAAEQVDEAPVVPVVEEAKPAIDDLAYSSKIAHLAKQEKALVAKRQEISAMQEQFKSYQGLQELAKTNPLAILEHFGLDFNSLTDAVLAGNDPETKRFNDIKAEIEALKQEKLTEAKQAEANKVKEAEDSYKWGIQKIAQDNADEFELVNHYNAIDSVYEVCKQYYEQTNQMLDLREALSLVEKDLEEQINPVINLKKVKTKFAPVQTNPAAVNESPAVTTASDALFSKAPIVSGGTSSAPRSPATTDEERRERALAWLK
jgi:hypothetical protein